jgi:hypothetical protein
MSNRLQLLENILDKHIEVLQLKQEDIMLNDSKQLTELLKAVQLLDAAKRLDGAKSIYDELSISELEEALANE